MMVTLATLRHRLLKSAAFSLQRDRKTLFSKPHGRGQLALGGGTSVGKAVCELAA
jgi:hypothetical protein